MKAVLMCAGKSTRTYPLTLTRPKPLLKAANKTLLEHNLEQLSGLVDEAVIIIGFMGGRIKEKFGSSFSGIRLSYVEQKEQLGTAHALLQAEKHLSAASAANQLKGKFVVLMGDDLYSREDIERCIRHEYCILGKEVEDPRMFGVIVRERSQSDRGCGRLVGLVEKPAKPPSNLANTALYVLDEKIFPIIKGLKKSERGEYEVTDAIAELARKETVSVETVKGYWLPVGYPWSLLEANELLLKGKKSFRVEGAIESGATLKGNVEVGKGTIVRAGSYIEGPVVIGEGCTIGPNCHIKPFTSIGDRCKICNGSDIESSIIMDGSRVPHLSFVGDSVIGENVNIAGGSVVANLRHDETHVKSMVNGQLVDTGRRKFGSAIGDGARLGAGTIIYPGRKIWPGKTTKPGEVVDKDIE
jgi:UDP-N-acetylglucosamine diphosphorylase / glucose-1-phosphate thymidylyltransferase / UDP-N-acetylgalactosamine diphosphorylase / glucosamine-1-phosphate N-acetyltransferase / galactosamine-1-phosphate N-acetyltransferase